MVERKFERRAPDTNEVPGNVAGTPLAADVVQTPFITVGQHMVMLGSTTKNNGREYPGSVRIRVAKTGGKPAADGKPKGIWYEFSYLDFNAILAGIKQHKALFDANLQAEKEKLGLTESVF